MTKRRLNQILNILLMPYIKPEFNKEKNDPIEDVRRQFAFLMKRDIKTSNELGKKYRESEWELVKFLKSCEYLHPSTLDDLRLLLNLYFPEQKIALLYHNNQNDRHLIEKVYLDNIYMIANSLLTFRDGRIAIRTWVNEPINGNKDIFAYPDILDKVEIWNCLGRLMVPDIFIVAFFVFSEYTEPQSLYGQTGSIMMSDKILEKVMERGIAETHVHMNACIDYEIYWEYATNIKRWENILASEHNYNKFMQNDVPINFYVLIFRMLVAEFFENSKMSKKCFDFSSYLKSISDNDTESIYFSFINDMYVGKEAVYNHDWNILYHHIFDRWKNLYGEIGNGDFLIETIYKGYKEYQTYSEMILLQKYLLYLQKNDDSYLRHLLFQYIRIKNDFFSKIVQRNGTFGLANFRLYYSDMSHAESKYINEKRIEVILKSMFHNKYLKKLEVRKPPALVDIINKKYISYDSVRREQKNRILKDVKKTLKEYNDYLSYISQRKLSVPTIGIVFHFIKQDFADNRIADNCWIMEDDYMPMYSSHLIRWRALMTACAEAIEELRSSIPLLSKYIVGIDAASEENKTEPWIFAPVYAAARNKRTAKPFMFNNDGQKIEIQNIGFTYHVGEEFRHILSGLRHIDEVIEHFRYKAGDRIGHAIALGENIDKWAAENEVVVMPLAEYLEDLLWIWGCVVHEKMALDVSIEVIEGKILELAKQVYSEIIGITPNIMYDAYMDKFKLDNSKTFEKLRSLLMDIPDGGNEHFCKYYNVNQPYGVIWTKEKILCTYFCPVFYEKLNQPILVQVKQTSIPLYKSIQEQIIKKVERKGIYIEVNPTSNMVIGDSDGMGESHIFSLNSSNLEETGRHEVMVTVNSDDPTIFNTTSENELAYIYYALSSKGYGKESILNWIDKVRQYGLDSSFVKHTKTLDEQIEEIGKLLKYIDEYERYSM